MKIQRRFAPIRGLFRPESVARFARIRTWYEFERPKDQVVFPVRLTPLQQNLLKLLRMDASAYR